MTAQRRPVEPAIPANPTRLVAPHPRPIVEVVDLGGVQVVKHGNLFLLSDAGGDVEPDGRGLGLYDGDTRILSMARLRIGGQRPVVLASDPGGAWEGVVRATNPELRVRPADKHGGRLIERRTLAVTRERWISDAYNERVTIANHTPSTEAISLELGLDVDMADVFEVRGYERASRGELLPIEVDDAAGTITFGYLGLDAATRRTHLAFEPRPVVGPPTGMDGPDRRVADKAAPPPAVVASWAISLEPGASMTVTWSARADIDPPPAAIVPVVRPDRPEHRPAEPDRSHGDWRAAGTTVECDNRLVELVLQRSIDDLCLLVNTTPEGEPYVGAGVPWFSTLFGRDALLTGLEAMAFLPWVAVDALRALAPRQSTVDDAWRDAEPGKILHELRTGEMARTNEVPFGPYYGTVDATPLFLVLLGEVFDWTGDDALVDELWPNAMAALAWIDARTEQSGDGFVDYLRRSPSGLRNQGWKDSGDAIRDRTGRLAEPPIALAAAQGYVYDARRRLARLARRRGDATLAAAQETAAAALRARFASAFRPVEGSVPMALDGSRKPMDAVASNMGHCLWSGIVADGDVAAVARRLMEPDLFSGWGIRTYAAGQPGYNPIGYHTGTVWPHDTAIAAAGLKAAGAIDAADKLAAAVLEAAQSFPAFRLPELFCGFERSTTGTPVAYPVACSPQAWAAAAPLFLVRTLLGLQAHADRGELELIRPHLPAFMGKLVIRDLRVGRGSCDLLVHRWRGRTSVEVLRKEGDLDVTVRL
ncbi:MAG: amylo-alpha-1,6-glucosidase [Chloroflexi bacterium]|nr:amylo-alpha-1,6-glucosidase [Chloroflexota bacterium]